MTICGVLNLNPRSAPPRSSEFLCTGPWNEWSFVRHDCGKCCVRHHPNRIFTSLQHYRLIKMYRRRHPRHRRLKGLYHTGPAHSYTLTYAHASPSLIDPHPQNSPAIYASATHLSSGHVCLPVCASVCGSVVYYDFYGMSATRFFERAIIAPDEGMSQHLAIEMLLSEPIAVLNARARLSCCR